MTKISKKDIVTSVEELFKKYDLNQDDRLDCEECKSLFERLADKLTTAHDKAAKTTKLEEIDKLFRSLDKNMDGFITREELFEVFYIVLNNTEQRHPSKDD